MHTLSSVVKVSKYVEKTTTSTSLMKRKSDISVLFRSKNHCCSSREVLVRLDLAQLYQLTRCVEADNIKCTKGNPATLVVR